MIVFKSFIFRSINVLKSSSHNFRFNRNVFEKGLSTSSRSNKPNTKKLALIGIGCGTIVGAGYSLINLNETSHIINEEITVSPLNKSINIKPSRQVRNSHLYCVMLYYYVLLSLNRLGYRMIQLD